uniref:Carboxylesterase type B domain-containing protein n=1 Tax=Ditylenchus dipsaci TaxID=166011 RepID=A0A915D9S0_9BILA
MAISAAKWTHQPKDAFKLSPVCVQSGLPQLSETEALKSTSSQRFDHVHKLFPYLKPQSEDCLYMNMYLPERIDRREGDKPGTTNLLSVLVVIHGGDYGWGGANPFNGSVLAAHGQILVVMLNYRLGIYGFLGRCEATSCTGNAGLSDLVAALKMLSNILPSFGADPASLTLLGWGSGASLVSLLMASPITQPKNRLFRRAILLDGSALCPWAMSDHPQQYFLRVAHELVCVDKEKQKLDHTDNNYQKQISQIVRCVQEHSQQNLTAAARKVHVPSFMSAFAPIVDGIMVPNHPKVSFSSKFGALFRDIDLMLGTVNFPAHHLISSNDIENGIEIERRDKILRTLTRNLFDYHRTEIFNAILNEYTDWENGNKNHPKTVRNNLLAALSDVLFTTPLIETARMHSTDEVPKNSNTFLFLFSHETKGWTREQPYSSGIRGSLSDEHIPYILATLCCLLYKTKMRSSKTQAMSTETTIEDRFHGTPWPQYTPVTREAYLEITDRPGSFIPQLNRGSKEVPEEHNFLPDHFNKNSFYEIYYHHSFTIRQHPKTLAKDKNAVDVKKSENYSLVITVAVGIGLLVLNLCVYAIMFRKCCERKRKSKKHLKYQSYTTGHPDVSYLPANSLGQQLPPPPPPLAANLSTDDTSHANNFTTFDAGLNSMRNSSISHHHERVNLPASSFSATNENEMLNNGAGASQQYRGNLHEQEPLLAGANSKSSTPGLVGVRAGISPTCPRHGRAAQLLMASRANSVGSTTAYTMGQAPSATLEEVQV